MGVLVCRFLLVKTQPWGGQQSGVWWMGFLQEHDESLIWAVKVFHQELGFVFAFFRHEVGCKFVIILVGLVFNQFVGRGFTILYPP